MRGADDVSLAFDDEAADDSMFDEDDDPGLSTDESEADARTDDDACQVSTPTRRRAPSVADAALDELFDFL